MMPSELYEYIAKRKSVRKYEEEPLDKTALSEILEFAGKAARLDKDIKTETHIIPRDSVTLFLPVKSPHYLMFTSEAKDGYLENAGFILQQIDLFLSSKGYGSCYVGMALPSGEAKRAAKLEYVIVLAFGRPAEPLYRTEISQFKRRDLSAIADASELLADMDSFDETAEILESVRLAPSATNSQPWFLITDKRRLDFFCEKPSLIKAIGYRKMNRIDMGIALCHCAVAAEHFNKSWKFAREEDEAKKCPKGYYYTGTILI
jgi:nitroreductase